MEIPENEEKKYKDHQDYCTDSSPKTYGHSKKMIALRIKLIAKWKHLKIPPPFTWRCIK